MYVYLLQGAQSGEDCGRQRGQLVVVKVKAPVGRREETVRLTLPRHRSAFACTSVRVRVCQCVSAVQVRAYLKKQPRQSSTRVKGHGYVICQTCKRYVYIFPHEHKTNTAIRCTHDVKRIECIYSQTHTSSILSRCHSC